MAHCLTEVHFWSLKHNFVIPDQDIGCFSYHEKQETADSSDHQYLEEKASYTEGRNITWAPKNKRPEKVKDNLKEVEDLLGQHRCVASKWLSRQLIQLMLSNGALVSITLSIYTGDIDRILIDKSLVGRLSADNPADVLWTDHYVVVCYSDKTKLDFIALTKKHETNSKKPEKLSALEPKMMSTDLPGPLGRKLDRQLTCNTHQDVVICWWPMASEEAWPWSPMTRDKERANLVLYSVIGSSISLMSFLRTDCDPLAVSYSALRSHQIFSTEQSTGCGGEVSVDLCVYETTRKQVHRLTATTLTLRHPVTCQDRNLTEDKLLLGCDDGSLVLYDELRKLTQITTAAIIPKQVCWHPSGTLAVVASSNCQFQIYDMALGPLLVQTVSENPSSSKMLNLASYFRSKPSLGQLKWSPLVSGTELHLPECCDSLFLTLDKGGMACIQLLLGVMGQSCLSPLTLLHQYIQHRQIDQAISLLSVLNWDADGKLCYACLSSVANHLLKGPLTPESEVQLEATLGAFYAPARPHTESTVLQYRDQVCCLARRFFHLLVRYSRFEKAFLLAVDIGARDLFMDLHYVALDRGESALAEVAWRKAHQLSPSHGGSDEVTSASETESEVSYEESYSGSDDEQHGPAPPIPPRITGVSQSLGKPPAPHPGHKLPSDSTSVDAHPRLHHNTPLVDMSQFLLQRLQADLRSRGPSEFTDPFTDENIIPPPPSHADEVPTRNEKPKLKVIHFGIV